MKKSLVAIQSIEEKILVIRGQRVMLDSHLAELYQVPTKRLNEQVKRNIKRFPADFMFQLSPEEAAGLRSQFATSKISQEKRSRGGRRNRPFAFTEQGVAMLSSVLNSDRSIEVNIFIMRAFVKIREFLANRQDFLSELRALEEKCDARFQYVFRALDKLLDSPQKKVRVKGFKSKN